MFLVTIFIENSFKHFKMSITFLNLRYPELGKISTFRQFKCFNV